MSDASPAPVPARSNEEIACLAGAKAALHTWAATVATRNVEAILALYAPDAILVPTLSNEVRDCQDSRREYFRNFLANEGLVCDVQIFKKRVSSKLSTVVVGGLYVFHYREGDAVVSVPARFLFTFEQIDGRWLITGHHSSREA
ncbi:protein kinase [Pseudomonas oryzihabitans]|nr:protein kinase [Pseudomonas psychrotolerans]KTT45630.1 protein kinase [Pseudomonas psychrotolerans]